MTFANAQVDSRALAVAYLAAKRTVIAAGYEAEIAWQEDASLAPITEQRFLSEAAWVVLSAGMRETVVRRLFPRIASAFANFIDAASALIAAKRGRRKALRLFGHRPKIAAIIEISRHVAGIGLGEVKRRLSGEGLAYLETLPYIGPVTAYHLAKNLGLDVAKPDRHLTRLALASGYPDAHTLCARLQCVIGEPVAVIDVVLWRFATIFNDYIPRFLAHADAITTLPASTEGARWIHFSESVTQECQSRT